MTQLHFSLEQTLNHYQQSPAALAAASGVSIEVVEAMLHNQVETVRLSTLSQLLTGLRQLTEQPIALQDIVQEAVHDTTFAPQADITAWCEAIFAKGKPFDWHAIKDKFLPLSDEEKGEITESAEFFIAQKEQDLSLARAREERLLELLVNDTEATQYGLVRKFITPPLL